MEKFILLNEIGLPLNTTWTPERVKAHLINYSLTFPTVNNFEVMKFFS